MSNKDGLYSEGAHKFEPEINSIPLSDVDAQTGRESIGTLVKNATEQVSTLVRSEVELAKAELATSAKKGAVGGGLFGAAGIIALYISFFFFIFVAELLAIWLPRWSAYLIVFGVMVVLAGLVAFIGFRQVKKIKAPKKTIDSFGQLREVVPSSQRRRQQSSEGLYS